MKDNIWEVDILDSFTGWLAGPTVYIPGVYVVCSVAFSDVFSLAATGAPVKGLTPTAAPLGGGMAKTG